MATNYIDQTIIPVCKGIITGLCLTLSIMLGVEQIHLNTQKRLAAVESTVLTTKDLYYEK
jgi:hypothetical protein